MTDGGCGAELAEAVLATLPGGMFTAEVADAVRAEFPQAADCVANWLRTAAEARNWPRVDILANLGAALRAPGLAEVVTELLEADAHGPNTEDLVDILGEIRSSASAEVIFRVARRSLDSDAPAFWLAQKAIASLGDLDTDEARSYLHEMTADSWPSVIRWYAAVELAVEDELGFDEDTMLG